MKKETYEKAKQLEARIHHIEEVIEFISKHKYSLEPPTRPTLYNVTFRNDSVCLNEGEMVFLEIALEDEKLRLQQEFVEL